MIPVPSGVRVWLPVGVTDMRRGMNGLAVQVQQVLARDPHAGNLYVFRGRRADLVKILWHDGLGMSLYAIALAVERLVLAELRLQDYRQQVRTGAAAGNRVERCRRLGDRLAGTAGELLPHGLDDFPAAGGAFEGFGDRLPELGQRAAATGAGRRTGDHHALAWQVSWQWAVHRLAPRHRAAIRSSGGIGDGLILAGGGLEILKVELHLVEQLAATLGGGAEAVVLELGDQQGDQQLEMRDHRLGAGRARFRLVPRQLLGRQGRAQGSDVIGRHVGGGRHVADSIISRRRCVPSTCARSAGHLRPPGPQRMPPIYAFQHVAQLRRGDRDHAVGRRGPHEFAAFEPLGIQRHAETIMP
jgi:transposase